MSASARLVGFCRGMPDVYTFVMPIFVDGRGEYVAQLDPRDSGLVTAFGRVYIDDGFQRADFDFAAREGGPFLFGFEVSGSGVIFGHPRMLSSDLEKHLRGSVRFRESRPRTTGAIERFIAFAQQLPESDEDRYLFNLMRVADTYVLVRSQYSVTRAQVIPRNAAQWQRHILRCVPADHALCLDAHQSTEHQLELLALSSKNVVEARTTVENALASVMGRCSVSAGRLCCDGRPVCHECLFRLASRYPSRAALEKLLELAAATAGGPRRDALVNELDIRAKALEAIHRFVVRRNTAQDVAEVVQNRHYQLLTRLEKEEGFGRRPRQMMAELGIQPIKTRYEDFVSSMRKENAHFMGTTLRAVNVAERHARAH